MKYHFHPEAEAEFNEAVDYYDGTQEDLGLEFAEEVYTTIENICQFPLAWTPFSQNTRRCLLKRFPYGEVYQSRGNEIIIMAVMQLNRKPDYWHKRKA
ncbi:MAG: type II toxin-antitoxin system RelE/ParE family toxin [Candidatus Tectomicrobia bacterium]|uniref:Type II toxin-antitoxin system RelE/ParE family toxin n=1 Tax=Tectimicrobiota bacterium TaxID=2528274 RepID=A0A933GL84_UNCTE|nr:type II toxin-antitoxin system RelE/ParE family toxin [Candidatus Tectomicrobia bacterium]